jgi:hypothetical protein
MEESPDGFIEAAYAAESRGDGDLRHRHPGLVDQLLGEEDAPGLRNGDRGSAKVLEEEATKLAFAQTKSLREYFYTGFFAVERPVVDESQRARNGVRSAAPKGKMRSCFGTAAKTWAKACVLGRRG